jgi:archaellum component FlaC
VSDLVERLRSVSGCTQKTFMHRLDWDDGKQIIAEAASEIERLRKELQSVQDHRARVARNRDMWKAQCERQADQLRTLSVPSDQ